MEHLVALEKKVSLLLSRIKELKSEIEKGKSDNNKLIQKNEQLTQKLETMKTAAQSSAKSYDEERDKTKTFVDNLIRSIDLLINEQQP